MDVEKRNSYLVGFEFIFIIIIDEEDSQNDFTKILAICETTFDIL